MLDYYLINTAIVYLFVGVACTLVLYFAYKRDFTGNIWTVMIMAVVGSYLGAVIEYLFRDVITALTQVAGHINIFPPLIVACIVIHIYHKVSSKKNRDNN